MIIGIDIGGSGSRLALDGGTTRWVFEGPRASVTGDGSAAHEVLDELLEAVARGRPEEFSRIRALGAGVTGLATLVPDPQRLADLLARKVGVPVALGVDAVTAHLGALGGQPGAVVSLGTGAIAVGWDGADTWRRVDGWGHLLGDRGGGAWIGMEALRRALLTHDGINPRGGRLLEAARKRFGEPPTWPGQLYTRDDRAGVLASFAVDVVELSAADEEAAQLVRDSGRMAAESLYAAGVRGVPRYGVIGGLASGGGPVTEHLRASLLALDPEADLVEAMGSPLDGALGLATRVLTGDAVPLPGFLWVGTPARNQ